MGLLEDMENEPEVIYELIITIINLLGMLANVLLIITILRKKSMRTKTNLYILNVSIADLMTLLVLLIYYVDKRILKYSSSTDAVNYKHIQCVLTNLEITLQIATIAFVIILVANPLFICKSQGVLLVIMWNFIFVAFYFNIQYCRDELTFVQAAVYVTFITCLLVILVAKYYLRGKNRGDLSRDAAFRLNFATIFVCLCLTSWVVNIAAEFGLKEGSIVKHFILAFGTSVKVGKNIALAMYLVRFNEMFRDSFMALFNCKSVQISESVNYSTDQTSVDVSIRNEKL